MPDEAPDRRALLERELVAATAHDVELALSLLNAGDAEADPKAQVEALRSARPYLFAIKPAPAPPPAAAPAAPSASAAQSATGALGAHPAPAAASRRELEQLRESVRRTGDRRALLTYLKARRNG
jgi:hypothetical protein